MPLWSPVDERRQSVSVFRKLLNMAFRPPDERSTRKLAEETGLNNEESLAKKPGFWVRLTRPPR